MNNLLSILSSIDGQGYKAYKRIKGEFEFEKFTLFIDHVQGDPFASPSKIRVRIPQKVSKFPIDLFKTRIRRVALCDYLTRVLYLSIKKFVKARRGSGRSGTVLIDCPGQEVLERSSVIITDDFVEARMEVGLPAAGRRILGGEAREIFFHEIPRLVERGLIFEHLDKKKLIAHVESVEDQEYLRDSLSSKGLVAFIADGSILPRRSGVDERPMLGDEVVPFKGPKEFEVTLPCPNAGSVVGMGIPKGVTLIVGGGFHGKTTLLNAIELGVYNHVLGDGRERVVSVRDSVKIRAEDGRRIEHVNISPFISDLPQGKDTVRFSTDDASGSTSQAANIIEALEIGTTLLLIDEDTSATNFMIRDERMQCLVEKKDEPITPFIDRAQELFRNFGVSTILVIGGCGDYFDVADRVIGMKDYLPYDLTSKARKIAKAHPAKRIKEQKVEMREVGGRVPDPTSLDSRKGGRDVKIGTRGKHTIVYGREVVDLSCVEQIASESQTRAIGDVIYHLTQRYLDGRRSLAEAVRLLFDEIFQKGLDIVNVTPWIKRGDYAMPRPQEVAFAINRFRTLRVKEVKAG